MQRKYHVIIAVCIVIVLIIAVPFIYLQSKYLALQVFNEPINKIELVIYKDKPFESEIVSIKTLGADSSAAVELKQEMDMENVQFIHPQNSSTVLFIYYGKGNVVNAYIGRNKIGLNYGKVWLGVRGLEEIIKEFK